MTAVLDQALIQLAVDVNALRTELKTAEGIFEQHLRHVEAEAKKTGGKLGAAFNFNQLYTAVGNVSNMMRPLINFTKEAVSEFMDAELAESKLAAAMQQRGVFSQQAIKNAIDTAEALQNEVNVSQELLETNAALVLSTTELSAEALPDLMRASIQVSALMGKMGEDGSTGPTLLRKAISGTKAEAGDAIAAFNKMGIVVRDTGTQAGNLAAILEASKGGWDIATAAADTTSGKLDRIKIQIKEVQEAFGTGLMAGGEGKTGLDKIGDVLQELASNGTMENLGKAAGSLVESLPTLTQGFAKIAEALAFIAGDKPKAYAAGLGAASVHMGIGDYATMAWDALRGLPYIPSAEQLEAYGRGVEGYYAAEQPGKPKDKTGWEGAGGGGTGGGGGGKTAGTLAAEAKAQAERVTALMSLYQKGGEYAKEALRLEPKLLELWKAQASEIELVTYKADLLTAEIKKQEEAAKAAAEAEKKLLAEIQANYTSVLEVYQTGTENFQAWLEGINGQVKDDSEKMRMDQQTAGEYYVELWKQEMGLIKDQFRKVPVWALEAWDGATDAEKKYLSATYGVTDQIEKAYDAVFTSISQQQQETFDEWRKAADKTKTELESVAAAYQSADEGLRAELEKYWPAITKFIEDNKTKLDKIIEAHEKKQALLEAEAAKQAAITNETGKQLDNERAITYEKSRQTSYVAWQGSATTNEEARRMLQIAQGAIAQGSTDQLIASLQLTLDKIRLKQLVGPPEPYGQPESYWANGMQLGGGRGAGGGFWGGGRGGAIQDLEYFIQIIQQLMRIEGTRPGGSPGTENNPLVVKIKGGGMGIDQFMEAQA